jgi:tetratricopeptide (TPR) repeat protein
MGMCLKKMGYLRQAVPEFEQARSSAGKKEDALRQLAEVYLALEQFDRADECLKEFQADLSGQRSEEKIQNKIRTCREKCLEKYLARAVENSRTGDFVNAIIYARKVLAIDPRSDQAADILEKSLEQRRQKIASTQDEVRKGMEEGKRRQELARLLAEAKKLVQENDFSRAVQVYRRILADHQEHCRDSLPEAHLGLSRAYRGQGDWESALRELQWLAERCPRNPQIHADMGDVYLSLSMPRYHESFEAYKKAIEADKKFVYLYLKMATVCIHLGKLDEAIQHYEDYLNLNPADYHSLVKLGDCYLLMGARDAAKIGYQAALRIQPDYSPAKERITRLSL